MEGMVVFDFADRYHGRRGGPGANGCARAASNSREDVVEGLENFPAGVDAVRREELRQAGAEGGQDA
jgi:hypothetical protein